VVEPAAAVLLAPGRSLATTTPTSAADAVAATTADCVIRRHGSWLVGGSQAKAAGLEGSRWRPCVGYLHGITPAFLSTESLLCLGCESEIERVATARELTVRSAAPWSAGFAPGRCVGRRWDSRRDRPKGMKRKEGDGRTPPVRPSPKDQGSEFERSQPRTTLFLSVTQF
jgi:hypothetical protein